MKKEAPWTEDEVDSLNDYQHRGAFHPFTGERKSNGDETTLIATRDGWVEHEGGPIVQTWAHDFMANGAWRKGLHPCLLTDACFFGLKHIGYWKPSQGRINDEARLATVIRGHRSTAQWRAALALPWPGDFIVTEPWEGREKVIAHLKAGKVNYFYDGWSECRLCGQPNGYRDLTDGVYGWPEGYAHYVEAHGVKPPQEFIDHVLGKMP